MKQFKHIDSYIANSFSFLLENNLTCLGDLGIYFATTHEVTSAEIELKSGGANISVTEHNKMEFMRLKCHYHAYL